MDYIVYDAPEKCLRSAASYLLDRGYSIENRTEDSLTLSRNPEIGGGLVFWVTGPHSLRHSRWESWHTL